MIQGMDSRSIIRKLEPAGWRPVRIKRSHHQFRHPERPNRVTVQHPRKDVPIGTSKSIERQSGIRLTEEFTVTVYIALLRKDPNSDYGVDFPDFPGCITAGSTLEETRGMAAEALEFHIEGMLEDDLTIPKPSSLDAVMADPENAEAIPFPVTVPDRLTVLDRWISSFPRLTSRSLMPWSTSVATRARPS